MPAIPGTPDESLRAGPDDRSLHERVSGAELLPLLYSELKALAQARIDREGPGLTLQATALVHEAYLRLIGTQDPGWEGRGHFFASAAQAMRRILVERARRQGCMRKVDGPASAILDGVATLSGEPDVDVIALDEALTRLAQDSPRKAHVVELLYFAGLSSEEAAGVLDVSVSTVKSDWRFARSWLFRELSR